LERNDFLFCVLVFCKGNPLLPLKRGGIDMGKSKVCVKQTLSRTATIVLLKKMLKGLESGSVIVGDGDGSMEFNVTDQIEVELKGKVKRDRDRVSISLSWPRGAAVPAERQEAGVPAKMEEVSFPAKKEKIKKPVTRKTTPKKSVSKQSSEKKKN
jgi:amphi-Trp domain-containing protein